MGRKVESGSGSAPHPLLSVSFEAAPLTFELTQRGQVPDGAGQGTGPLPIPDCCLSGDKGKESGSGKTFSSFFFLGMWWYYYCFKEGRTDESVRKSTIATSPFFSESYCLCSKAGFSMSCEAQTRSRTMKEVFFCGSWVEAAAKSRVTSL